MCLTSLQFDVTLATMNYWKSICRMRNPAGPDGMQIKWPSSFPSWELQRVSERKSLTNYNTALKTFSPLVNKDKGTHQSCWRIVITRREGVAECVSSDAACFPFKASMLEEQVLLLRKSLQQKHWLWALGPSNDFVIPDIWNPWMHPLSYCILFTGQKIRLYVMLRELEEDMCLNDNCFSDWIKNVHRD